MWVLLPRDTELFALGLRGPLVVYVLEVYEYQKGYDDYEHYGTEGVYLGAYAATGNAVDVDGKILYAVCCEPTHHEVIKAQGEGQNEA